jgi:processive 1,2-diacylglycerol beta-glucosyltransferase
MAAPKKVVILTLSVGSGHLRASWMIEQALSEGPDEVETRVVDVMDLAENWFHHLYVRPYWLMLRYGRGVWRGLYERRHRKRHRATAPAWMFRRGCAKVLDQLRNFGPDLVIVTEVGAAEIAVLGKREGWFHAPILAVQTDLHAEPPWVQDEIDFYCVGSHEARSQLIGWGVSSHRILVCGIPIDPAFSLAFDRSEARRRLGLAAQRPVVLVMGGGMGPAPLDRMVLSLDQCGLPLQVVAVAGHDGAMRERVEALRGQVTLDLRALGWTDRVPELMAAADVLITKPGGLTISEALAAGLPLILTHPIPGPEERHVRYLVKNGVALYAASLDDIPRLVGDLLAHPEKRAAIEKRARELSRPDAVHAVAQVGRALMEKATYIDLLAAPPEPPGESAYVM